MDRNEIIRMAREAGAIPIHRKPKEFAVVGNEAIERFAALVAAAEREACAKICDSVNNYDNPMTANDVADAIRARGN